MKQTQQLFKWITLLFFGIAFYAMTIAQIVPVEFADSKVMHFFYDVILQGLPIATLLTLIWTLKKERPKITKVTIGIVTLILAAGMLFGTFALMFSYGFGAWVNEDIIYQQKDDPEVTINQQIWDIGAFGYGGQRTVKLTPFLGIWNLVEEVDTTNIDIAKWTLVQKEGDVKFP